MATALIGLQSIGSGSKPTNKHREQRRRTKDSKRRQAALLFLNNISLDGQPQCRCNDENTGGKSTEEPLLGAAASALTSPPTDSQGPVSQVTEAAASAGSSSSSFPGVLSPSVRSVGLGANDVFFEGDDTAESPDASLPALSGGQQQTSRGRSAPALSPVPAVPPLDPRPRLRNASGSPGPKVPKKVHFIKSMRQYDTRGCSDTKLEAQRRHSSVVAADLLPSLEGVELGACGKTVSYAQFLYPTNALMRQKGSSIPEPCTVQTPPARFCGNGPRHVTPARLNNHVAQESCAEEVVDYDPNLLSDPQWPCGRHKRVLIFASYVTTVMEYVKPSDLKKDMNETFKEKFPHILLTLSKIRSLKREMRAVSEECSLQPVTIAMAFVYFEKLVLQGRLNKQNRKLVAAACVLLAAKISSDLRKPDVKQLIDKLEDRFRINRRELVPLEFSVLVAMEMGLYLPESKVMPHYRRLVQQG
ncbi:CDK5 and ABL1 enzyme substrate 2 isoform X2 [Nerophis ophidion]|uniref:CDK5 and ABL1 enzyme substrate 2 isoform X2 n=1 Tax=Nerophis ophidion TaxID=159077 RepID=UPI002ADF1BB5|nr:CDK5 and ABL1 enzyme substrate 2 isoform X2 [Nerophis ophidion]